MKKKICIMMLTILLVLCFIAGCSSNASTYQEDTTWEILEVDGKFYISFPHNERPPDKDIYIAVLDGIYFDSVEEAQQAFLAGKLSEGQITYIKKYATLTKHGFLICDIANLCEPMLPSPLRLVSVSIRDGYYQVSFGSKDDADSSLNGFVSVTSDELFQRNLDTYHLNKLMPFDGVKVLKKEAVTRNGTDAVLTVTRPVDMDSDGNSIVKIQYELTKATATVYVTETYACATEDNESFQMHETPTSVELLFDEDVGQDYYVSLQCSTIQADLGFLPDAEWLTSFELIPHPYTPET